LLPSKTRQMAPDTQFNLAMQDDVAVIRIVGDLDHYNTSRLRSLILDLIDKDHRDIIFDLAGVDFMDSGGMSGIVFAIKRLSASNGHLRLANCNPRIARKLEIGGLLGLGHVLSMCTTVEQAVAESKKSK
jgi:anti-anti-sigma factor